MTTCPVCPLSVAFLCFVREGANPAGGRVELPAPPVNPRGRPRRTHFLFPFRAPANRSPQKFLSLLTGSGEAAPERPAEHLRGAPGRDVVGRQQRPAWPWAWT